MGQPTELILLVLGLMVSNAVHAHFGSHVHGSFESGLLHPFSGVDHLLAMVSVGVWAARSGHRSLVVLPAVFVLAMAAGAAAGMTNNVVLPLAEAGMAGSVLILGVFLALAVSADLRWAVPLTAAFAACHGYAHGVAMPDYGDRAAYYAGFLMATAALHASGAMGAVMLEERVGVVRAAGLAISVAGAWLLLTA